MPKTKLTLIDCEQGSQEWLNARLGILTASNAGLLMVNGKHPQGLGDGLITHICNLTAEQFTGESADEFAGNEYTERGKNLESVVNTYYVSAGFNQGLPVQQVGIFHKEFIYENGVSFTVGASPDGLVGDEGGLEIKTRTAGKQVKLFVTDCIDKEHIAQVQFCLWVTGRKWWDYVSYSEGLPPYVHRFYPDLDTHSMFEEKCFAIHLETQKYTKKIIERSYHNGVNS